MDVTLELCRQPGLDHQVLAESPIHKDRPPVDLGWVQQRVLSLRQNASRVDALVVVLDTSRER